MPAILLDRPESFTREVPVIGADRDTGQLTLAGCMDDRHLERNPWNSPEALELMRALGETEYDPSLQFDMQAAAGVAGIAHDAVIALVGAHGGKLRLEAKTPEVVTTLFERRARHLGILSLRHRECAGDMKAPAANRDMANGGEVLWKNTREIYPAVTQKNFNLCVQAAGVLLEQEQIPPEDEIIELMERDMTRVPLVPETHSGKKFIADWRKGRGYHTREARIAGHPAYYTNFDTAKRFVHAVGDGLFIPEELFATATAMRHAALVGGYLPHPDGPDERVEISRLEP